MGDVLVRFVLSLVGASSLGAPVWVDRWFLLFVFALFALVVSQDAAIV